MHVDKSNADDNEDNSDNKKDNPYEAVDKKQQQNIKELYNKYKKKFSYAGDFHYLPFHIVCPDIHAKINRTTMKLAPHHKKSKKFKNLLTL